MAFQGDSIFWVDTEKVVPNPFQPRREFDQNKLQELSESIRMYGVLQPLTVTRSEVQRDDGTFYTEYELIAGERRLRASRLAGVAQVPVIIREGEQNEQEKLELAIIENLQREDLNAIDRALAFQQLAEQFELSHTQVAQKVGRSREYVSNSIRLLALPDHIKLALQRGDLGEGHARTLLMLSDKPEEQETIFREILLKKMSVREVERIVRKIATDKVRKKQQYDIGDHLIEIEKEFTETLGTRVQIQKTDFGGKLTIDYFSEDDLSAILKRMQSEVAHNPAAAMAAVAAATPLTDITDQVRVREHESQVSDQAAGSAAINPNEEVEKTNTEITQPAQQLEPAEPRVVSYSPEVTSVPGPVLTTPTPAAPSHSQPAPNNAERMHNHSEQAQSSVPTTDQFVAERVDNVSTPEAPRQSEPVQSEPQVQQPAQPTPPAPMQHHNAATQPSAVPSESSYEHLAPYTPSQPNPEVRSVDNQSEFNQPAAAPQPAPHVPEQQPVSQIEPTVETNQNTTNQPPVQQTEVKPDQPKDEAEDIYSVRHFSI